MTYRYFYDDIVYVCSTFNDVRVRVIDGERLEYPFNEYYGIK